MTFLEQLHSLAHVLHEVLHAGIYIFVHWTSLQAPLFCRGLAFCRSLSEKSGLGFFNGQVDNVRVLVVVLLEELSSSYGPVTTLCTIDGDRVQWGRGVFYLMQNYFQPAGEQAAARNVGLHFLAHTIHGAKVRTAATTGQDPRIKIELAVTRCALS